MRQKSIRHCRNGSASVEAWAASHEVRVLRRSVLHGRRGVAVASGGFVVCACRNPSSHAGDSAVSPSRASTVVRPDRVADVKDAHRPTRPPGYLVLRGRPTQRRASAPGAPFHSRAGRSSAARGPGCVACSPNPTPRVRTSAPAVPSGTRPPRPTGAPVCSRAGRASTARGRGCSASSPTPEARARASILQCRAVRGRRLQQALRSALPLAEPLERNPQVVLRPRPLERHALARVFLQCRAVRGRRFQQALRSALRSPSVCSAVPRLFCTIAQSNGTRSRVRSSSAER